jgi:N-acetylglutamate synthase-like GNAT family acetyltransferase
MIRRANPSDIPAIHSLNRAYALEQMPEEFLNSRDICLVAETGGKVAGYIWAGLMARNTFAYVAGFAVDPTLSKQGIGERLAKELLRVARMKGVKSFVATIKQDKYHDQCAVNCLKAGAGAAPESCTFITGNTDRMVKNLKDLEESA